MVSEERARSDLFRALERSLGEEAASTIMERLPPRPWTDIATHQDLANLRSDIQERFAAVDGRFERLEERLVADAALREERVTSALRGEMNTLISTQTKTIAFTLLGAITAHSLALIAAVRL